MTETGSARYSRLDSQRRSVAKAITWRLLGLAITMGSTWLITGETGLAAVVGLVDTTVKIGVYYFHERARNRSKYGRRESPEYQI